MQDSQFELFGVIRPHENFETTYQGQSGARPIAFPGDLDSRAGQDGFAQSLGSALALPGKGTRVKIWIPQVLANIGEAFSSIFDYYFQIQWRVRSFGDYLNDAQSNRDTRPRPFSIKGTPFGYPDGSDARYFIPGGSDVLLFEQAEPAADGDPGFINIRKQSYVPMIDTPSLPLAPNTTTLLPMLWTQGVYQNASGFPEPGGTPYAILDVESQGDEMAIWFFKLDAAVAWDFAGVDAPFSRTFGTRGGTRTINESVGIMVTSGIGGG